MSAPVALIIGITGQDGSYLAELLLAKGYVVHGLHRRTSAPNLAHVLPLMDAAGGRLHLHYGDLTEVGSLLRLLQRCRPNEVYNLAGPTLPPERVPQHVAELLALGTQRLIDAIRLHDPERRLRLFQASGHEIFGRGLNVPAHEATPLRPDSTLGVARLQAYWMIAQARERYGLHAASGILFPHDSPRRGAHALSQRIVQGVMDQREGATAPLRLRGLDVVRDWGHARDHVEAMWRMLQQDTPTDLVLSSGTSYSLREVAAQAFALAGSSIRWEGHALEKVGRCQASGRILLRVAVLGDARDDATDDATGDATLARHLLGWQPGTSLGSLLAAMLEAKNPAALVAANA